MNSKLLFFNLKVWTGNDLTKSLNKGVYVQTKQIAMPYQCL